MCLHQCKGPEGVFQVSFDDILAQGCQLRTDGIHQTLPADYADQAGGGAGAAGADVGEVGAILDFHRDGQGDDGCGDVEPLLPGCGGFTGVDQQHGALADTRQYARSRDRHQRIVGDDHQVGAGDDAAFVNGHARGAYVGEDRCATPLGTIARRILDFIAFREKGAPKDAAGRFHALATASMKANPVHYPLLSILPGIRCGSDRKLLSLQPLLCPGMP